MKKRWLSSGPSRFGDSNGDASCTGFEFRKGDWSRGNEVPSRAEGLRRDERLRGRGSLSAMTSDCSRKTGNISNFYLYIRFAAPVYSSEVHSMKYPKFPPGDVLVRNRPASVMVFVCPLSSPIYFDSEAVSESPFVIP